MSENRFNRSWFILAFSQFIFCLILQMWIKKYVMIIKIIIIIILMA